MSERGKKMEKSFECDDAISRDAVMRLIENKPYDWSNLTERHNMLSEIRKLPSVTHWSGKWEDLHRCWICSECGQQTHIEHNYCPNCGAKMESEEKE